MNKDEADKITEAARRAAVAIAPMMKAMANAFTTVGKQIDAILWRLYNDAGKPYGDTRAARDRWFSEYAQEMREREEAAVREAWEAGLERLRTLREAR